MKITIDGPAGSGKSTVAKVLADKLGFFYIDSGALYRALAFYLENGKIEDFNVDYSWQNKSAVLKIAGQDISQEIRQEKISKRASEIAKLENVRNLITDLQRKIAATNNVVLEGRDAGTVVFPEAEVKFFLTASLDERTKRRALDLKNVDFEKLKADIKERDLKDSTREFAPLVKAKDAIEINTDGMKIDEVVDLLMAFVK